MRLVISLGLVVIVGLVAGDIIGMILGAGSYWGSLPGAIVAVSVFLWRRREEGGSLEAIKTARRAPLEASSHIDSPTDSSRWDERRA
jgi:hypothetical protein